MYLTKHNHNQGFLVADNYLGGVCENLKVPGTFVAYVLDSETATYLRYFEFRTLFEALDKINAIALPWSYQAIAAECGTSCSGCSSNCS